MTISIKQISKHYNDTRVFENLSLNIENGEVVQIKGKTGKGKTTLKRCIAGLENYHKGNIGVEGDVAYVFQDQRTLPWLNVKKNILTPLKLQKKKIEDEEINRLNNLASKLGVEEHLEKNIREVSGGQLQRLLLVRALITDPDVLLLDEPFNSLDSGTAKKVKEELFEICRKRNITVLIATHGEKLDHFVDRSLSIDNLSN